LSDWQPDGGIDVPAKKTNLSDAERAKRMRALGREAGDNDPASFDRAFDRVVRQAPPGKPDSAKK
jgi:hypothetical protein